MAVSETVLGYIGQLPDASGRRAVVTGGNAGLGLETARFLAHKGAAVLIGARDIAKAEAAREDVLADVPTAEVSVEQLDLASLASVRQCADSLNRDGVDIVVCNAGTMALDRAVTEDGFEAQFGVNHLGHFALVGHLYPGLVTRLGARVVSVTSGAAYIGRIDFDDPMGERDYDRWRAYNQSKLANLLFAQSLARRFVGSGSSATAHAAHPGLVFTQLQRRVLETADDLPWWNRFFLARITPTLGQDAQMGALPLVYAALSPAAVNGDLWGPRWMARGRPVQASLPRTARDVGVQERLWRVSEELTGTRRAGASLTRI